MIAIMPRDRRTKHQGVYARHQQSCRLEDGGERCNYHPSYYGSAWDRATGRMIRTRRFPLASEARSARADLIAQLDRGETPASSRALRLTDARERFVKAAREAKALNKRGRRYKPSAIADIEQSLKKHAEPKLGRRRLTDIRRSDVQMLVDEMTPRLSGSRVRSVVNAVHSLYAWAQDRELAQHDPAQRVRLPALDTRPVERVCSPGEFARLLEVLEAEDALAYALAGYGFGRKTQVQWLEWPQVDLSVGAIEWGVEWLAAKYDASHRTVPTVAPLLALLKRVWMGQGRPADGRVLPARVSSPSGLRSMHQVAIVAADRWEAAGLERVTLLEARHAGATWLDAAGVSPRVASVLMGHAVPAAQVGAAPVTLRVYSHALPEDIERARGQLDAYLLESMQRERNVG